MHIRTLASKAHQPCGPCQHSYIRYITRNRMRAPVPACMSTGLAQVGTTQSPAFGRSKQSCKWFDTSWVEILLLLLHKRQRLREGIASRSAAYAIIRSGMSTTSAIGLSRFIQVHASNSLASSHHLGRDKLQQESPGITSLPPSSEC